MRFSGFEIGFVAWGALLGALVGVAAGQGILSGVATTFPPFVIVLLSLGLSEVVLSLATSRPPGALVAMPARVLAFVVGLAALFLVNGSLA